MEFTTRNEFGIQKVFSGDDIVLSIASGPDGEIAFEALKEGLRAKGHSLWDENKAQYLVGDVGQLAGDR